MIIFLYGPDSYRRLQKQKEIFGTYQKKYGNLSHDRFNLSEDEEALRFKEFINSRSLFGKVKFAIAENALETTDKKAFKNILRENLEAKDLIILIASDKEPPAAFKFLKEKPAQNQFFSALNGAELIFFINKEALARGINLSADIARSLGRNFKDDTWSIATELDKIALVENPLPIEDESGENYFELINILKSKKETKQKLIALEIILSERRDEAARVFNSLSYQLYNKESAELFADYDVAVKSGKLDYEEILLAIAIN